MLRLEKVNGKNVWELLKLRVSDDQKGFVACNDTSIIEAYTAITGNGYAFPFGIYNEDTPVGFTCSRGSYAWDYCERYRIPVNASEKSPYAGFFGRIFGRKQRN